MLNFNLIGVGLNKKNGSHFYFCFYFENETMDLIQMGDMWQVTFLEFIRGCEIPSLTYCFYFKLPLRILKKKLITNLITSYFFNQFMREWLRIYFIKNEQPVNYSNDVVWCYLLVLSSLSFNSQFIIHLIFRVCSKYLSFNKLKHFFLTCLNLISDRFEHNL